MIRDNELVIVSAGGDPFVITGNTAAGKGSFTVELRMKSNSKGKGQFFWATAAKPAFARAGSVFFEVTHDNQWHDYTLKLPVEQAVKQIRLDPSTAPGEIRVEWLRLKDGGGAIVKEWRFDAGSAR